MVPGDRGIVKLHSGQTQDSGRHQIGHLAITLLREQLAERAASSNSAALIDTFSSICVFFSFLGKIGKIVTKNDNFGKEFMFGRGF